MKKFVLVGYLSSMTLYDCVTILLCWDDNSWNFCFCR